jgi:hypothetical protein
MEISCMTCKHASRCFSYGGAVIPLVGSNSHCLDWQFDELLWDEALAAQRQNEREEEERWK